MVYRKQQEKLLDELREKSDSESFDDDKEKILNVEKAVLTDNLKARVLSVEKEMK